MSTDLLAPDASPNELKKAGVRRVNNIPLILVGFAILCFVVIMASVAADRAQQQSTALPPQEETAESAMLMAKEIVDRQSQSAAVAPPPNLPVDLNSPPVPTVLVARPEQSGAGPLVELQEPSQPLRDTAGDEEAAAIRQARSRLAAEALRSPTSVKVPLSSSSPANDVPQTREEMLARIQQVQDEAASVDSDNPTEVYQRRLEEIRKGLGAGNPTAAAGTTSLVTPGTGPSTGYSRFAGAGGDRYRLDAQLQAPTTPYELRAGFVIPATLIAGINSDLPGQITAQVSQNVYDTATGRHLLIPQGSRLVGEYSADVGFGQSRVLVAWQRIVFPDGKALDIGAMPGADQTGASGFSDKVNNHYLRLFGSALLLSGITAGVTLSQDSNRRTDNSAPDASSALSESLGQQLGQVTAQLISKNINTAPTLEIRPGYRLNVVVTKDLPFNKPYRSFDY